MRISFALVKLLAITLAVAGSLHSVSILDVGTSQQPPSVPIDEWLSQGEQRQFKCDVHIGQPTLTFQQRYRVFVKASLPAPSLQRESVRRDLHFFLKVADENGKWFSGQTYNHFRVEKQFDKRMDIELDAGLYLQPGKFTVAVIVYDSVLQQHNIVFRHVRVQSPKDDAFPQLLSALPRVEFLPAPVEGVATLASGHALLPIQTERPVELDIVVDLSPYTRGFTFFAQSGFAAESSSTPGADPVAPSSAIRRPRDMSSAQSISFPPGFRRPLPQGVRRTLKGFQSRMLEAASILSDLDPRNGCARVTVFNTLSRRVLLTAQPALSADWLKTWDDVFDTDLNIISVQDLAGSVEAAKFFRDQVEKLMAQAPTCNLSGQRPIRILALLSRGAHFPYGANQPSIEAKCDCRAFYLLEHEDVMDMFDDLQRILKPLSPRRMEFQDPRQFRRKLAALIETIQTLGAD